MPVCPDHEEILSSKSISEMCDEIIQSNIGAKIMILAPLVRGKKGEHLAIYEDLKKEGFVRVKINDLVLPIEEFPHKYLIIAPLCLTRSLINSMPIYPVEPATKMFSFCIIYYNCCN